MIDDYTSPSRPALILRAMEEEHAALVAHSAEAAASHRALAQLLRDRAAELEDSDRA